MVLKALKQGCSIGFDLMQESGLKNYHWCFGLLGQVLAGESPFFLTYGSEVVLPTELEFESPRVQRYNEK